MRRIASNSFAIPFSLAGLGGLWLTVADAGRAPRAVGEALGLSYDARMFACEQLNLVLADTQVMHALYKKCHWPLRGPTFYQLHLLLDKHAMEQLEVVDALAERGQTRG